MIVLLLSSIIFIIIWKISTVKSHEPPRLSGWLPFIGHAHLFIGDTKHFWKVIQHLSKECSDAQQAYTMFLGLRKYYLLTDPDDCLNVSNSCLQKDIVYDFAKPCFGDGLVTSSVPVWKRHRKLLNPVFNQRNMLSFLGVFNEQSKNLVENLSPLAGSQPFDHEPYVHHIAMDAICATALGTDLSKNSDWNSTYRHASKCCFKIMSERFQKVWLHFDAIWNLTNMKKTLDMHIKKLHNISNKIVKIRKESFKIGNIQNEDCAGKPFKPFLDLIFELNESYGEEIFSDKVIREHVDTFIVAGHDTVASTLVYALLLIGTYPEVQDKIYNELKHVFGKSDRNVTKEDLPNLEYLEAVLKETMRIYPAVPVIARNVEKNIKLKNYTLTSGSTCVLLLSGVHMHPIWGQDMGKFIPERWLDTSSHPKNPNAFVPFSLGRRVCIGRTYAMFFMKTVLAHVLRQYRITGDHHKLINEFDAILKPVTGHFISIEHRSDL